MIARSVKWRCINCRWSPAFPKTRPLSRIQQATSLSTFSHRNVSTQQETGSSEHFKPFDILPAKHPDLPTSPFLDPEAIAKLRGDRRRKPPPAPKSDLERLHRRFNYDPYAQALARPLRLCAVTQTRLPSSLLIRFGLLTNPNTNTPWLTPVDMLNPHTTEASSEKSTENGPDDDRDARKTKRERKQDKEQKRKKPLYEKSWIPDAPTVYAMANYTLIAKLAAHAQSSEKKGRSKVWEALVSKNMRRRYSFNPKSVVCREDMADYILDLLRRQLVFQLGWLAGRKGTGYLRSCRKGGNRDKSGQELLGNLKIKDDVTSVLWLGPINQELKQQQQEQEQQRRNEEDEEDADDDEEQEEEDEHPSAPQQTQEPQAPSKKQQRNIASQPKIKSANPASSPVSPSPSNAKVLDEHDWDPQKGPRPFLLVQAEKRKDLGFERRIPIYNLPELLGPEQLAHARRRLGDQFDRDEFLTIKGQAAPLQAQLLLLKLQFYLLPLKEFRDL